MSCLLIRILALAGLALPTFANPSGSNGRQVAAHQHQRADASRPAPLRLFGHNIVPGESAPTPKLARSRSVAATSSKMSSTSSRQSSTKSGEGGSRSGSTRWSKMTDTEKERRNKHRKENADRVKNTANDLYGFKVGHYSELPYEKSTCTPPSPSGDYHGTADMFKKEDIYKRAKYGKQNDRLKIKDNTGEWHYAADMVMNRDYLPLSGRRTLKAGEAERIKAIGERRTERERKEKQAWEKFHFG